MSGPLYDAWMGREAGPFVEVFEPWTIDPRLSGGRRSFPHASEVPVSFAKVPITIDPADLAMLRSCVDVAAGVRREWAAACEATLRAALAAVGAVPAGAGDEVLLSIGVLSRCMSVAQPDGSLQCFWGSAYLCTLPPCPLEALRLSVDARLRDGLVSGGGA